MTSSQDFTPQGFTVLGQRVNRLEDRQIDLRLAVSSLIETVNLHQANFEAMQRRAEQREIEMDRKFEIFVTALQAIQSEVRGLQAENRRILDYLLGQQDDDSPDL
jgi:hypothetical protein